MGWNMLKPFAATPGQNNTPPNNQVRPFFRLRCFPAFVWALCYVFQLGIFSAILKVQSSKSMFGINIICSPSMFEKVVY